MGSRNSLAMWLGTTSETCQSFEGLEFLEDTYRFADNQGVLAQIVQTNCIFLSLRDTGHYIEEANLGYIPNNGGGQMRHVNRGVDFIRSQTTFPSMQASVRI